MCSSTDALVIDKNIKSKSLFTKVNFAWHTVNGEIKSYFIRKHSTFNVGTDSVTVE